MSSPRPADSESDARDALVPRRWAHATVAASMHCRNCGYDLRGLDASGRCPECGRDVWATVVHTVDPAASRLPSLRNPVAVGNALVVLNVCMLIGTLLIALPAVADVLDSGVRAGGAIVHGRQWWHRLPALDWHYALLLAGASLWSIWTIAPPRGAEPHGPVWDDVWRLAVGFTGWIACATMLARIPAAQAATTRHPRLVLALAAAAFAIIGLIGLRGVFEVIGQRSREYRRLQSGRQSVGLMVPAIASAIVGRMLTYLTRFDWFPQYWRFSTQAIGQIVAAASILMILIGLAYLVVNAWSIRTALRKPPPALDEVLLPRMPNETWVMDRED